MTTRKIKKVFLCLIFCIGFCLMINLAAYAATGNSEVSFGTEVDLLPYVNGGYYLSGIIGYDHYNIRVITTKTTIPDFVTPDGYEDWKLKNVTAIILDYFPSEDREGFWLAGGFERWKSEIQNETTGEKGDFTQNILTVGCGYIHNFNDHWYVNPWAALHYNLSDDSVAIGSGELKLKEIMYEASLKLGYRF